MATVPVTAATPVDPLNVNRSARSSASVENATVAESADVTDTQDNAEPITFDDLRQLVAQFEATGEVTFSGARRMLVFVDWAEFYHDRGYDSRAVLLLEHFKEVASDPTYVPSESAREQLTAAADQLIVQLGGAP
jgi:hypothetical protein